jgi:hypothetical protein
VIAAILASAVLASGPPQGADVLGRSADGRWIFFTTNPMHSSSLAADGLMLQVAAANGRRAHKLGLMLPYSDYLVWCGGRLVFVAGGNRLATTNKRLVVASPPDWNVRRLVGSGRRAWGALTCAPDERSVVVQSQRESRNYDFAATRWALWRAGFDGSLRQLTSPPRGRSDDSPRFSANGHALQFVRSHRGKGQLFELRGRQLFGPLRSLGYRLGYYGHRSWWPPSR